MDKIAMVKVAEVSGVVAAMAEAELIKIASEEMFDAVVDAVAGSLDNDYDLNAVLAKTAEVMSLIEDENGLEKDAGEVEEVDERAALAAYGELSLLKEAGDITEEKFAKEAAKISDILAGAKKGAGKVKDFVVKGAKGAGIKDGVKYDKELADQLKKLKGSSDTGNLNSIKGVRKGNAKNTAKALGRSAAVYGGGLAAAGGTAVGGKALYDKYKG